MLGLCGAIYYIYFTSYPTPLTATLFSTVDCPNPTLSFFTPLIIPLLPIVDHRVQGMLDFDFMCGRKKPSVAAMVSNSLSLAIVTHE